MKKILLIGILLSISNFANATKFVRNTQFYYNGPNISIGIDTHHGRHYRRHYRRYYGEYRPPYRYYKRYYYPNRYYRRRKLPYCPPNYKRRLHKKYYYDD